jgi:hypothetical protein
MPIETNNNPVDDDEEEDVVRCPDCEEPMPDGWTSEYDAEERCYGCHNRHLDYMHESEYEDEYMSRSNDESQYLRYYSYRPSLNFWSVEQEFGERVSAYRPRTRMDGRQELHMGFELEVEVLGGDRDERIEGMLSRLRAHNLHRDDELMYFKEDGSIDYGFEIVTQPCTPQFYEQAFPWDVIERLRQQDCAAWNRRSCGLHIHMNRRSFASDKHLWKFLVFIYKNPDELTRFAGRSSSYAKFSIDSFLGDGSYYYSDDTMRPASKFITHAKGFTQNYDRYTAVNLQNVETIELRFFRPSLNTSTVRAALQFCDALQVYTEELTTQKALRGGLKFAEFDEWLKPRAEYTLLYNRIRTRLGEGDLRDA